MTTAKTKDEFEKAWFSHVKNLYALSHSLDRENTSKLIVKIHEIEDLIKIASEQTYGKVRK